MRNRKEDPQQLSISDFGWIVFHLDRFRVACRFRRHLIVSCSRRGSAGVAHRGVKNTFHSLEDRLRSPKTATREDSLLLRRRCRQGNVYCSGRDWHLRCRICRTGKKTDHVSDDQENTTIARKHKEVPHSYAYQTR